MLEDFQNLYSLSDEEVEDKVKKWKEELEKNAKAAKEESSLPDDEHVEVREENDVPSPSEDSAPVSAKRKKNARKATSGEDLIVMRVYLPVDFYWEVKVFASREKRDINSLLVDAIAMLPTGKKDTKDFVSRKIVVSRDKNSQFRLPLKSFYGLKRFAADNKMTISQVATLLLSDYLNISLK